MKTKRNIEIFSAGCPVCQETIDLVNKMACPSCEVSVLDMNDSHVLKRSKELGINSIPAVAINGELAPCCAGGRPDENILRQSGLGQPI